eukprot:6195504-Pleurochrysis_carterae.AAC.3
MTIRKLIERSVKLVIRHLRVERAPRHDHLLQDIFGQGLCKAQCVSAVASSSCLIDERNAGLLSYYPEYPPFLGRVDSLKDAWSQARLARSRKVIRARSR